MPSVAGAHGWPKARDVVCHSAEGVPHGEGHNRVCVCHCQWCKAERDGINRGPVQPDLFSVLDSPPLVP